MIKGEQLRVSKQSLRNTHQWTDTNNNEQKNIIEAFCNILQQNIQCRIPS